jgi:UDP-N-acetylenolpyruvoylglucosamine reductase
MPGAIGAAACANAGAESARAEEATIMDKKRITILISY